MQKHHAAWLLAHPDRSSHWLWRMLDEGFDVHHIDRNHENNDPDNLILIESTDHARLHGRDQEVLTVTRRTTRAKRKELGRAAYRLREAEALSWWKICQRAEGSTLPETMAAAEEYARVNDLKWPPLSNEEARALRHQIRYHKPVLTEADFADLR